MKRYLIELSYDGTFFHGWQSQPQARTVQDTLEEAITKLQGFPVKVVGSGRTDAGVHAIKQFAHVDLKLSMNREQIKNAVNTFLPVDVIINNIFSVDTEFNARYSAEKRIYLYRFSNKKSVFERYYVASILRKRLNFTRMKETLSYFKGEHDFTSFSKFNPDITNQMCIINEISLSKIDEEYQFVIGANRFLHNMVRRIIGTIMNISHFDEDPKIILELLNRKNPSHKLIYTAPANGLYLKNVFYPSEQFI